jgi:predicted transcriptional regulator
MKRKPRPTPVGQMNVEQLARATREFDQELVADSFEAPGPTARAQWQRARRKRGRPRLGRGVKVISVSLERSLLRRCDALAKRIGTTRASLISRGLQEVLSAESAR